MGDTNDANARESEQRVLEEARERAIAATEAARAVARENGLDALSIEEIDEEIAAARTERRRRSTVV